MSCLINNVKNKIVSISSNTNYKTKNNSVTFYITKDINYQTVLKQTKDTAKKINELYRSQIYGNVVSVNIYDLDKNNNKIGVGMQIHPSVLLTSIYEAKEKKRRIEQQEKEKASRKVLTAEDENTETFSMDNEDGKKKSIGLQIEPKKLRELRRQQIITAHNNFLEAKKQQRIHSSNKEELARWTKIANSYRNIMEILEGDYNELDGILNIDVLRNFIQQDISRLEYLVNSKIAAEIIEAKLLIDFYKNIFSIVEGESPFFETEQIKLPEFAEIRKKLSNFQTTGEHFETTSKKGKSLEEIITHYNDVLIQKARERVLDIVNSEPRIISAYGRKLTIEELLHIEKGAEDINWLSKMIQDPQFQLGAQNPILAQIMNMKLEDSFGRQRTHYQSSRNKINEITPNINKLLSRLGLTYNIFREKEANGMLRDAIISRFTSSIYKKEREMRNKWNERRKSILNVGEGQKEARTLAFTSLKREIAAWYKKNFLFFDIDNIPEIAQDEEFAELFEDRPILKNKTYADELKSLLGEYGYKEEIDKQKKLLRDYIASKSNFEEDYRNKLAVIKAMKDSDEKKDFFSKLNSEKTTFNYRFNPFILKTDINLNKIPNNIYDYNDIFLHKIPRKYIANEKSNAFHIDMAEDKKREKTTHWNEDFEIIEKHKEFKDFHNMLTNFLTDMYNSVPADERHKFNPFSMIAIKKSLRETILDPKLTTLEKFSKAWEIFRQWLLDLISQDSSLINSHAKINPLTGEQELRVSMKNLKFNKGKINDLTTIEVARLKLALNMNILDNLPKNYNLNELNLESIAVIADALDVDHSLTAIKARLKGFDTTDINLYDIIKMGITNGVVEDNSHDLSKTLMLGIHSLAAYKARQEVLPTQLLMKGLYEDIPNVAGKIGSNEKRTNAIKQMRANFKRAVLGDDRKNPIGGSWSVASGFKITDSKTYDKLQKLIDKYHKMIGEYEADLKDAKEDGNIKNYNDANDKIHNLLNKVEQFKMLQEENTKYVSLSAVIENVIYSLTRFLGLAYNLKAASTNYFQGQFANYISAAGGRYFDEDTYYRANAIMKYVAINKVTLGKLDHKNLPFKNKEIIEAKLVSELMTRYNILQDAYNVLQKIDAQSKTSKMSKFAPKYITSVIEFHNQSPIMISVLMETMIKGKDGKEMSVWDSMVEASMNENKPIGSLSDNYATEQNRLNYESMSTEEVQNLHKKGINPNTDTISKISDVIVKIHGDYHELRGNLASQNLVGQGFIMFKRWVGSMLYNRLGVEHINLRTGTMEKGRFRSFSPVGAALFAASAGVLFTGGTGALILGGVGYIVNRFLMPSKWKITAPETDTLNVIKEMAVMTEKIIKGFIGLPISLVAGKKIMKKGSLMSNWNNKFEGQYTKTDLENIRSNIADITIMLWITAIVIMVKSMFGGGDDDDDKGNETVHNIMVNQLMQLSSEGSMLLDITDKGAYENFIGSNAPVRFLNNVAKTTTRFISMINSDDDTITKGKHIGESKFLNQMKKTFFPAPFRGMAGFATSAEKQFNKITWDWINTSDEDAAKKKISNMSAESKKELIDMLEKEEANEEEIESMTKTLTGKIRKYYRKPKGKTYEEKYEEIKDNAYKFSGDSEYDSDED